MLKLKKVKQLNNNNNKNDVPSRYVVFDLSENQCTFISQINSNLMKISQLDPLFPVSVCMCVSYNPTWASRPSMVVSANGVPSLNLISVVFIVDAVFMVYSPPFSEKVTVGVAELPSLRITIPTPA